MIRIKRSIGSLIVLGLLLEVGCRRELAEARPEATSIPAASVPAEPEVQHPYPPGRWRLAPPVDLERPTIFLSHILVRHRQSQMFEPVLSPLRWQFGSPPERTRAEALAIARDVAREARSAPARFGELAFEHSEDRSTREAAGSMGGVMPIQLIVFPEVLDTIQALHPGEVSQVVETGLGFHVFWRRPPPPEQVVSGQRIVIAHDEAPFLRDLTPDALPHPPQRSRSDALALASQLFARAQQRPDEFDQLLIAHSEHQDVAANGDIGTWSTLEPSPAAREIEVLSQLEIGQVARPIDSMFGFLILKRTPNRPRRELAMTAIQLSYDSSLPDSDPSSFRRTREQAQSLARQLAMDPGRFDALQAEFCCAGVQRWREGSRAPVLGRALLELDIGEIASEPVRDGAEFLIPKRLDPGSYAPPPLSFELPSPDGPEEPSTG